MNEENQSQKIPALLSVIDEIWIDEAFEYFQNGKKDKLYFFSDSGQIKNANSLGIKCVYFKITDIFLKKQEVVAKADFIEITIVNPVEYRLPEPEVGEGKYYYGFKNLRRLKEPVDITELQYFSTGNNLLSSTPGATIIKDPNIE